MTPRVGVVPDVRPGQRITGDPPVIEDIRLLAGKNTEVSKDGSRFCSTMNGHIMFLEGRINVEPLYEIKGDVDISTGNIDFLGTVDIAGSAVYPGRLIVIRNSVFEVMERLGPTTFYLEGDQIRQRPPGRIEKGAV